MAAPTATRPRPAAAAASPPQTAPEPAAGGGGLLEAGAEVALVGLSVAAVVSLGRLFVNGSFLPPVLTALGAAHLLAWGCRRLRWGLGAAAVLSGLGLVLVVAWVVEPSTTTYGVPGAATWHQVVTDLDHAWTRFSTVVAPAPVSRGFVLASVMAAWVSAFVADVAAFRLAATFETLIPSFTMFVFGSVLGADRHRVAYTGVYLGTVLVLLAFLGAMRRSEAMTWLAGRRHAGGTALVRRGLVVALMALVAALVFGPHVPGARGTALLDWRNKGEEGPGSRVTVSPLVDIRRQLVDVPNVEFFAVRADTPARWRLTSLDHFDGRIWGSVGTYEPASGGLPTGARSRAAADSVTQSFQIEALASIWLPAAYRPTHLDGIRGVRFDQDSSSLLTDALSPNGLEYTVESALPRPTAAQLAGAGTGLPASVARRYLQLPGDFPLRVTRLAQSLTGNQRTTYDKARALQNFFLDPRNFTYDLHAPPGHGDDALVDFLFRSRRGYCEQFAGAYAAMARAVGLPARVAVGFQHGILDGDGVYHVRGQDAHAWPEVYISGYGWLAFDDTPGRAGQVGEQNYDSVAPPPVQSTQPQSSQDTTTPSTAPGNQTPSTTEPPSPSDQGAQAQQHHHRSWWSRWWWVVVGLGLPTLGGSAMGAMILLRRQRWAARRAAATSAEARVLVAWEEAEEALALAGVARRPWETPREYADRAPEEAAVPARPLVDLADDATAAAFSAAGVPDVVAARAEKSAASVKAELELGATRAERLRWALGVPTRRE